MRHIARYIIVILAATLAAACGYKVTYNLTGGSIPPDAKTFSVAYFPNNAPMVAPTLSTTLTEALRDKFSRQTRLQQVDEGGDFAFEGEITNYSSTTASVSSGDYALQNRLTITVKVTFTNAIDQTLSFNNKSFSSYADYDSSQLLLDVQDQLIEEIVEKLVNDIYMAAAGNW
ncbi:LPS-assembly lipoprotein LptE [Alistipes sp.]|jgi:outer membrane lipopolysaccharide assembly protein LptE/RlpB|nr:LptE family protein [Alistipes sp.]GFI53582.1 LPS-assembly lipoprotein LptE [Alistipes sp.]